MPGAYFQASAFESWHCRHVPPYPALYLNFYFETGLPRLAPSMDSAVQPGLELSLDLGQSPKKAGITGVCGQA